jgi:GNAT superfamily N-acetyltransferase
MIHNDIQVRTDIQPGDIGAIIHLHGLLYAREYGWDATFEGYVAASFGEFVLSADYSRSRLWIVEKDQRIAGSIGIVGREGSENAQLRWFLLAPDLRGRGIGRQLMHAALQFCADQKFQSVFLWTVSDLTAAARLYQDFGFLVTEEKTHLIWGKMITEVRYDLTATSRP